VTSLANRNATANSVVESALSIAGPPRFSVADSARMRPTSPTTCARVLRDPRLGDESAFASPDLDEAAFDQF